MTIDSLQEQIRVKVDATEMNTMDLCPERWNLEFMENWKPQKKAKALERGILIHQMLAHYYRQRMMGRNRPVDMPDLVSECIMIGRVNSANSVHINADEFQDDIRVFKEYFQRWQYDSWEILAVETPFSKILYESPKLQITFEGIIDLLIVDPKEGKHIVDHKTESRESDPFVLSNQFQAYEWAHGLPVIINKIGYQQNPKMEYENGGGQKKDMRFRRHRHFSGPEAIKEWREDTIERVIESLKWEKRLHEGKRIPKNRTSCDKWGGCIFQEVCKNPPDVREHKLRTSFYRDKPWDVYERDAEPEMVNVQEARP